MTKLAVHVVAATTVATTFVAPSNAAPPPGRRKCGFNSATDITREAGWQTGDINAGPLYAGAAGTVHCRVVVNGYGHSSPPAVDESVRDTNGVVVMAPRAMSYQATAADHIVLCTSWVPDTGTPLYWVSETPDFPNLFSTGHWETSPNAACTWLSDPDPNEPECSIWLAVDQRLGTNIAEIWQDCEGDEPII